MAGWSRQELTRVCSPGGFPRLSPRGPEAELESQGVMLIFF